MHTFRFYIILLLGFLIIGGSSCSSSKPAAGQRGYTEQGKASYYSNKLHGRKMANGDPYHRGKMTAAHRTLPFGTKVKVTNLQTNKTVKVKITDRGPFVKGRVVDLSEAAAKRLNSLDAGVIPVKLKVVKPAPAR
ncbi:septal ring lytic transglycosylase RlpA family protein [Pontibacter roseus]|uniref:septal ring lytic transglycosylase RlpA family protein n=1 Tax=Pontibacter roseus TaxID=336989 RepID=UPI00036066BF|nr:septal ring lytic transglycosylase RlpA family protein [Pontibacter roseus]